MKVKIPKDYITYESREIDKGEFVIHGNQYKFPTHLVVKDWVKTFESREEKIKWRQERFWNLRYHAWYKRWFADGKGKKNKFENYITKYIMSFIEQTVDCDHNEYALACRAMIYDNEVRDIIGQKNIPKVNEALMSVCFHIRHDEEGIVDMPFAIAQTEMSAVIEKARKDRAHRLKQLEYQKSIS